MFYAECGGPVEKATRTGCTPDPSVTSLFLTNSRRVEWIAADAVESLITTSFCSSVAQLSLLTDSGSASGPNRSLNLLILVGTSWSIAFFSEPRTFGHLDSVLDEFCMRVCEVFPWRAGSLELFTDLRLNWDVWTVSDYLVHTSAPIPATDPYGGLCAPWPCILTLSRGKTHECSCCPGGGVFPSQQVVNWWKSNKREARPAQAFSWLIAESFFKNNLRLQEWVSARLGLFVLIKTFSWWVQNDAVLSLNKVHTNFFFLFCITINNSQIVFHLQFAIINYTDYPS